MSVCGAIGRAAVKLAEEVEACIKFELTQRCAGFYKDMLSEQSIGQPTDMPIMSKEQPKAMLSKQSIEQPTDMLIIPKGQPADMLTKQPADMLTEQQTDMPLKQLTDMLMGRPKEQSINMGHSKMKPNMIEMAMLEGAHSVFKGIIIKNRHLQSKHASVMMSCGRHAHASFGRCICIDPYDRAQVRAFPCSCCQGKKPTVGRQYQSARLCSVEATAMSTWSSLICCRQDGEPKRETHSGTHTGTGSTACHAKTWWPRRTCGLLRRNLLSIAFMIGGGTCVSCKLLKLKTNIMRPGSVANIELKTSIVRPGTVANIELKNNIRGPTVWPTSEA